ncbi:MAG: MBL fold metallo-hydrolase [Defluviimonas sp.]|nr:MBL fold metallo-hydrolase [Defluviimonas sp.]
MMPAPAFRLRAVSGFGVKGPACFLLEAAGARLMLDLGEGPDAGRRPDLAGIGRVDAIVISHGHADHAGALDLAAGLGTPPVFATAPVRALAADPRLAGARDLPLAGQVRLAGLAVETGPCGHAPGAVWMRIGGAGGLLYTGDMGAESSLYRWLPPPPARALVFDASYGAADEPLAGQLAALAAMAAARPLLLPAPPAGRGLEMALAFAAAGLPVALCPAHRQVAGRLLDHPGALVPGGAGALAGLLAGSAALRADSPAEGVMIAARPNGDAGLAAGLIARFVRTREAGIVFTGHLATGKPAAALVASGAASFRRWNVHPRRRDIAALAASVRPGLAMAAFVAPQGAADLAAALPSLPLVLAPEMRW